MFAKDKNRVLSVIQPLSGAEILWEGQPPPKGMKNAIDKAIKNITIVELKDGVKVELPSGNNIEVTKEMVGDNKKYLLLTLAIGGKKRPIPLRLVKIENTWKIDPTPIINEIKHKSNNCRRMMNIASISRACISYVRKNKGEIPLDLTVLKDLPNVINIKEYTIVAKGNIADQLKPGSTVLVREIKTDDNGRYAAGYLDGHADFRKENRTRVLTDKKVRAVCKVCGAWVEGGDIRDDVVSNFTINHINKCSKNKLGTLIRYIYPNETEFNSLKQDKKEK